MNEANFKYCPLISKVTDDYIIKGIPCNNINYTCAWYDKEKEQCIIHTIKNHLKEIEERT
jgi:hypothetical protein